MDFERHLHAKTEYGVHHCWSLIRRLFVAGPESDLVQIDRVTGALLSTQTYDRETLERVSFLVVATDLGSPSQSATATVSVTVTDVNDNVPVFSQSRFDARLVQSLFQLTLAPHDLYIQSCLKIIATL